MGVMTIGILNIIAGVFVEQANHFAHMGRAMVTQTEIEDRTRHLQDLRAIFDEIDSEGTGKISLDKFLEYVSQPEVHNYLAALQVDVTEASRVFDMLDVDGSKELEVDEFVIGCMRIRDHAKMVGAPIDTL